MTGKIVQIDGDKKHRVTASELRRGIAGTVSAIYKLTLGDYGTVSFWSETTPSGRIAGYISYSVAPGCWHSCDIVG